MSSATRPNMPAANALARSAPVEGSGRGSGWGMSPRQMELNRLWSFYRCSNYDGRKVDWNGQPVVDKLEHEVIATAGFIPPGFYDAGSTANFPLKFRRPSAPYYLGKVIVDRFTGLLFSEKRHPKIVVEDDERTEEWLGAFAKETRLWAKMIMARTYGGAMGSVAIGFKVVRGKPKIEVHDPRWCSPTFVDRESDDLERFEKRYIYPDSMYDAERGVWVEDWFWYRRVIDRLSDCVWPKVPVDENGLDPDWDQFKKIEVQHGFGFCPVVWVQNRPVQDDIDGDPDCHGPYDMIEEIDRLTAMASRGTLANCDPTVVVSDEGELDELRKSSQNAIKLSPGGSASYLEITGTGPKAAREHASELRDRVLEVSRCVLDTNFGGPARTGLEVDRNYASMIEQADVLREQYGEMGVKKLLTMVVQAARLLEVPRMRVGEDGIPRIERAGIKLPPKVVKEDGMRLTLRHDLGEGEVVELYWPDYFEPSLDDVTKAVTAAGQAKQLGLVGEEEAIKFIADYFGIEDIDRAVQLAREAQEQMMAALDQQMMGGSEEPGGEGG